MTISAGPELVASDISFAYPGAATAALRHVDLNVAAGEVVLITGVSGCGKSTLALALCGLIPSRVQGELRGRVTFGGRPLTGLPPHEASQLVGIVFQNPNLQLINHTVQSEVAFGPENLALPQPEIAARVAWCLDVTGMAGLPLASTVTLSGGQKQRTAIAATLAMRPRVLVLDEPLSDLDPLGAQEVLSTLRRLARDEGTGVVIIEHRVDEVAPWADRVVLMDAGRVIADQPPRDIWADLRPWSEFGVGVPDMVLLASELPEAFTGSLPLSVEEALGQVREGWLVPALTRAAMARAATARAVPRPGARSARAPVLSWDGVSVDFDARRAVDDVTLAIDDGEWVAMIGANGSGKSTLTGLAVGLGKPSAGQVRFRGKPIRPGRVFEHAAEVALLLQAADEMLFEETVIGELKFGSRFRALPPEPVLNVAGAIDCFGFAGLEQVSPWTLSQGGRQRLALAALLVGAPGVLVLDEPTTGQDAERMRAFLRLLEAVRRRTGLTILTVVILSWDFMLIVFALSLIPWIWLRPSKTRVRVLAVMVVGPALTGFWSQGLYYLPNPPIHYLYQFPSTISWLGSPGLTSYGLVFGLEQSARVLVTVSTSMLILVSTDVGDFTWAFERFRMPPQVGFALTAALRFLPDLIARTTLVLRAVELRGYDLSRPRWFQVARWLDYVRRISRCVVLVTVPLLVGSLRGTATMAMVADARGFGASKRRGSLREHRLTRVDVAGYVILVALVATAVVLNHFRIGARTY